MGEFIGTITQKGLEKDAASFGGAAAMSPTVIRVGDGNGAPIVPNRYMTDLVHRVGNAYPIIASARDATNPAMWRFRAIIPAADGPFDIREIGLFDAAGDMLAIAKHVLVEKRTPAQGAAVELETDILVPFSDTAQIVVQISSDTRISLDRLLRAPWLSVDGLISNPPANPALGSTYIVAANPTGAWAGLTGKLAQWNGSMWVSWGVPDGHRVDDASKPEGHPLRHLKYSGGIWVVAIASPTAYGVARVATTEEVKAGVAADGTFVTPDHLQDGLTILRAGLIGGGGGDIQFSMARALKWSSRFIAVYSRRRDGSAAGDITMRLPAVGTVISCQNPPAVDTYNVYTPVTVTAEGVPMMWGAALVYDVGVGDGEPAAGWSFRYPWGGEVMPHDQIIVAHHNPDNDTLTVLGGVTLHPGESYSTTMQSSAKVADTVTPGLVRRATSAEVSAGLAVTPYVAPVDLAARTRERLTSNRTFYVRSDGNDSNSGAEFTAAAAFVTLQGAADAVLRRYDPSGYTVTFVVGNGTFSGVTFDAWPSPIILASQSGVAANCEISASAGQYAVLSRRGSKVTVQNVKTVGAGHGLAATNSADLLFAGVSFANAGVHIYADYGGRCIAAGNYQITASGSHHWLAGGGGVIVVQGATVSIPSALAFTYFALAQGSGSNVNGGGGLTISGAGVAGTTGQRYHVNTNAVINMAAAGASALPGNTAGTSATGGQYV